MLRRFCFQAQKHLGLSLRLLVAIPMPLVILGYKPAWNIDNP